MRWRFCMEGLGVGIEAGGISPEISPAWAVYTAGGISTSAIINSIPDVRSATFKGVRPSGGQNMALRSPGASFRVGRRAHKNGVCRRGCYETRLRRAKHSAAFETGCRRFEQEKQNGWLKLIVWRVEPSTARSRVRLPCASGCRP